MNYAICDAAWFFAALLDAAAHLQHPSATALGRAFLCAYAKRNGQQSCRPFPPYSLTVQLAQFRPPSWIIRSVESTISMRPL